VSAPTSPRSDGAGDGRRRLVGRRLGENGSTAIIGLGILMLMQPFALELYTWSFVVILVGTVGFSITSHFRE
jgi:hypothetical protein